MGITCGGDVLSVVLPGNKDIGVGYTITEIQNMMVERKTNEKDTVKYLFLISNSKDVFKWKNGKILRDRSSSNYYNCGTAAIVVSEPLFK